MQDVNIQLISASLELVLNVRGGNKPGTSGSWTGPLWVYCEPSCDLRSLKFLSKSILKWFWLENTSRASNSSHRQSLKENDLHTHTCVQTAQCIKVHDAMCETRKEKWSIIKTTRASDIQRLRQTQNKYVQSASIS